MKKQERIIAIRSFVKEKKKFKTSDIIGLFDYQVERTSIYRDLKSLVEKGELRELGKGKYEYVQNIGEYFQTPFFEREQKTYNHLFLESYIPNESSFFTSKELGTLLQVTSEVEINTQYYRENRRSLENLLIDLSYASSKLEGNTYSYLDTEVLVNYNEIAEEKGKDETQMILNHKNAIEYLVYHQNKLTFDQRTFFDVHSLLGKGLLPKDDLGRIREKIVEIGRCKYTPIDNTYQLKEEFSLFLEKLNLIKNPFEQSLFILIFIPYFQIFLDINKRTSRMLCNLPLLKNNLGVLSLLQVKERDYITAILAIYELNDVSLMKKIFVENYLLNIKRYI